MPEAYTVKQGDCISSIAYEHGFFWQTLWNHGSNASLKSNRKNPNVLMQGDVVQVPDLTLREESAGSEKKHRFKLKGVPAKLRLRLLSEGKARPNERYRLVVDNVHSFNGKTDSDGVLEQTIPPNARIGRLILQQGEEEYSLNLGHLDPVDEITGVQARLLALGFNCGAVDGELNPRTKSALRAFQKKHGLAVDGSPGETTQKKLREVYGC